MKNIIKINKDLFYLGVQDRKISLFEAVYPVLNGVSYNSYFLNDEKTVLFDTVDKHFDIQFFENLEAVLDGRTLDYFIINYVASYNAWRDKFGRNVKKGEHGIQIFAPCKYNQV